MRVAFVALLLASTPAFAADSQVSTIKTLDAANGVFTLTDNTIWQLDPTTQFPADLVGGDRVAILFQGHGDDGIVAVWSLARL